MQVFHPSAPPPLSRPWAAVVKQNTPAQEEPERPAPSAREQFPARSAEPQRRPASQIPASAPARSTQSRARSTQGTAHKPQTSSAVGDKRPIPNATPGTDSHVPSTASPAPVEAAAAVAETLASIPAIATAPSDASSTGAEREPQSGSADGSTAGSKATTPRFREVRTEL